MQRKNFGALFISGIMAFGVYSSVLANEVHDDSKASGAVASITEEDIEYSPEEQIVRVGQHIRVINRDPFDHKSRVTEHLAGAALGNIVLKDHVEKPGSSYAFTLDKPGTYEIRCMLHDGMTATIKAIE